MPNASPVEKIRTALREEVKSLRELLDHIELNDASLDAVILAISRIEKSLKRIRRIR